MLKLLDNLQIFLKLQNTSAVLSIAGNFKMFIVNAKFTSKNW